jgi:tryptophan-rich sensory protein
MWWNIFYAITICVELIVRYNITSSKRKKRFVGCVVALFAQFLWMVIFYHSKQYMLMPLNVIDFLIWTRGCLRNRGAS